MTENVADMGGLQVAFDALQLALQENDPGEIDGLTQAQRFFIAAAQVWREKIRDEALHLPGAIRFALPPASPALRCRPGTWTPSTTRSVSSPAIPLYIAPEDRVVIW